jgi:hypothetical protein
MFCCLPDLQLGEEDFASLVLAKLINKIANSLSKPIDKLTNSIASANNFLHAALQQQATELLSLQELVKQQNDVIKSLTDSLEKLSQTSSSHSLTNLVLPQLKPSFLLSWEINYIKLPKYLWS